MRRAWLLLAGALLTSGACVLLGFEAVPCAVDDDCPTSLACRDARCAAPLPGEGEGEAGEGEGEGEGEGAAGDCAAPRTLVEGDNTGVGVAGVDDAILICDGTGDVWRFDVPAGAATLELALTLEGEGEASVLVRRACDDPATGRVCVGTALGPRALDVTTDDVLFVHVLATAGAPYTLTATLLEPLCGDGVLNVELEECEDGNDAPGDGCDDDCTFEGIEEIEPNDDGDTSVGGDPREGNDFATFDAQGPFLSDAFVRARLDPNGDEDVFALRNVSTTETQRVAVRTRARIQPCHSDTIFVDTVLALRDGTGDALVGPVNDVVLGTDLCSAASFDLPPQTTIYAHVLAAGDTGTMDYVLHIDFE